MTYNVNYGNGDVPGTLEAIAAEDADIVLLQEITDAWKSALVKRFGKAYPHRKFHIHARSPGGDLNEAPDGSALAFLAERGFVRAKTAGPTTWHHSSVVDGKRMSLLEIDIDHVMVDGTSSRRMRSCTMLVPRITGRSSSPSSRNNTPDRSSRCHPHLPADT